MAGRFGDRSITRGESNEHSITHESTPDFQVLLTITKEGTSGCDMRVACINISRTTHELKQSLATPLGIAVEHMEIWKGGVQMKDDVIMLQYDISADDVLEVKDTSL